MAVTVRPQIVDCKRVRMLKFTFKSKVVAIVNEYKKIRTRTGFRGDELT